MPIHHGDVLDLKALDAARHEVDDPIHLCLGESLSIPQRQDDRGPRPILIVSKQSPFRGGEVDAGSFNLRHLCNGPCQLPLQRATIIELLDEIRHADR